MTAHPGQPGIPHPRPAGTAGSERAGRLRQIALHLETAAVLEARAQRAGSSPRAADLRRRAGQRRREAARLRGGPAPDPDAAPAPAPPSERQGAVSGRRDRRRMAEFGT